MSPRISIILLAITVVLNIALVAMSVENGNRTGIILWSVVAFLNTCNLVLQVWKRKDNETKE